MKRLLSILLVLCAVCLCGCGEKREIKPYPNGISCDFIFTLDEISGTGNLAYSGGALKLKLKPEGSPETTITVDDSGVSAEFLGLEFHTDSSALSRTAVAIKELLDTACGNPAKSDKNGLYKLSAVAGDMPSNAYFTADGSLSRIEIPAIELLMKFGK